MNFYLFLLLLCPLGIFCQFKTKPIHSHNLVHNASDTYDHSIYQHVNNYGESANYNQHYPPLQLYPQLPMDKIAKFLNETRSKMSTGICHTEVPTESLVRNPAHRPIGNGSDPSLSKIQICCDGYERNIHNYLQCDPVCQSCINGICVAPDVCVCYPDHVRNYAGFCLSTCPIGCGNGECQPDGSCLCKPGYVLDAGKKFCAPYCSKGCHNGNCTAPETCECAKGFEVNGEGTTCEPKCNDCNNGRCIEPGVCRCLQGYDRRGGVKCEPICRNECFNGFCAAPDVCGCHPGWTLDPTGRNCVAHCDRPCLNGYCSGTNTCACNTGYIKDEFNANICQPHCPQGCTNGYCSAPNLCLCKPGFAKSGIKGRLQCMPVS